MLVVVGRGRKVKAKLSDLPLYSVLVILALVVLNSGSVFSLFAFPALIYTLISLVYSAAELMSQLLLRLNANPTLVLAIGLTALYGLCWLVGTYC